MRSVYGITKALAFAFLTLDLGLHTMNSSWSNIADVIAVSLSWLAITMTIARGLPVLIEGYSLLKEPPQADGHNL
jgi:hypothetical protein